jgi:hypothetical protein
VSGFSLPDETVSGEILQRLIPNGRYTWRLTAVTESSETDEASGILNIQDGDATLPDIVTFTVSPNVFSPNQDGIDDHSDINVYLSKDVPELTLYLLGEDGEKIYISERNIGRIPGELRHTFDYAGGVDQGMDPPPDGTYTLVVEAQDLEGQLVRRTSTLTIQTGGEPEAEIAPQSVGVDVVFDFQPYEDRYYSVIGDFGDLISVPDDPANLTATAITMPVGDILSFRLTVINYSHVPIRTAGPPPGTIYVQDQLAGALGFYGESGAWVVGIQCDTSTTAYPWRWALGTADTLDTISSNGNTSAASSTAAT